MSKRMEQPHMSETLRILLALLASGASIFI
jgi:hypothetical protein